MGAAEIAIVVSVITVGAAIQGAIGFGVALIAAPILVLVDPQLVPGPMMMSSFVLACLVAWRDRAHANLAIVRYAAPGNVVGAAIGAMLLARLDASGFALLFGVLVLLAVALSALGLRIPVRRRSAIGAGLLGGFMATTAAIGGPAMALVYQHEESNAFRGTLATYFVFSSVTGLAALFLVGKLGPAEAKLGLVLIPGQIAGFMLSSRLARRLEGHSIRPYILGLSSLAALAVLARAAFAAG